MRQAWILVGLAVMIGGCAVRYPKVIPMREQQFRSHDQPAALPLTPERRDEIARFLELGGNRSGRNSVPDAQGAGHKQALDALAVAGNLVVRADLPGIKKEDIRVDCEDGALRLSGTRREESTDEGDGYFHSERTYGSFARVIPLPKDADQSACKAKFDNGVLEVTVPMPKEKAKPRQIDIQ